METKLAERLHISNYDHLVWDIEISDLGNSRPFRGFSLTGQYLMVGITSPDQQNKVDIQSIPEKTEGSINIPIRLGEIDFPQKGKLRLKGIGKLMPRWEMKLIEKQSGMVVTLKKDVVLSLAKIQQSIQDSRLDSRQVKNVMLEIQLTPK
ncbi:MAG: hypothetical protein JJ895_15970 [Balneolaceae bacterium]|nr:hypothetical protein [Balneolaceae bacterium]